jgi:hypothetical protein
MIKKFFGLIIMRFLDIERVGFLNSHGKHSHEEQYAIGGIAIASQIGNLPARLFLCNGSESTRKKFKWIRSFWSQMSSGPREAILAFLGCFNPPTVGHLGSCGIGYDCLRANGWNVRKVVLIPAHSGYGKPGITPGNVRLEMCKCSVGSTPYLEVDDFEVAKDDWTYTVVTLHHLQSQNPDARIFLLCRVDLVLTWLVHLVLNEV